MTDLDNFKKMLTEANIQFTVDIDTFGDEIELMFTPDEMDEEVIFTFSDAGKLKEVY